MTRDRAALLRLKPSSADGLSDSVGEDGTERGGCKDQRDGRLIVDRVTDEGADYATNSDRRKRISDATERAARAAMILGERTHASGAGRHVWVVF